MVSQEVIIRLKVDEIYKFIIRESAGIHRFFIGRMLHRNDDEIIIEELNQGKRFILNIEQISDIKLISELV